MTRDANHGLWGAALAGLLTMVTMPAGCSASPGLAPTADAGGEAATTDAPAADAAPATDGAGDAPACTLTTLPILTDAVEETLDIPVTSDGKAAALLVDTGAPSTYVWLPLPEGGVGSTDAGEADDATEGDDAGLAGDAGIAQADAACSTEEGCVPDAGSVTIGCDALQLPGFPQAPMEDVHGRPVVGTIGDDMLLAQPAWLDLAGSQLVFHAPGDPFSQASAWPATAMTRPYGYIRVEDVSLDGTPVKLLLDTGSSDVLWLGQQPGPGDVEVTAVDALGQPVIMYIGKVTLSIGSFTETVQVDKVPSFPYFQPLATAAGVVGLFGVSAFPKGVVFDTDAMKVRVAQ